MELGYDYYGNVTNPEGKGVTVVANTAMVAEQFSIRGVRIDTEVENDEEQKNPDNVVFGEYAGLAWAGYNKFYTGAGDDLVQVTEYHVLVGTVFQEHLVKESIHCHFKA